jgi:hypothetical protein
MRCLAALRFASARLGSSSMPLGVSVAVSSVTLSDKALERLTQLLNSRKLRLDVVLPGSSLPASSSHALELQKHKKTVRCLTPTLTLTLSYRNTRRRSAA